MDACVVEALGTADESLVQVRSERGEVRVLTSFVHGTSSLPDSRLVVAEIGPTAPDGTCAWRALDLDVTGWGWHSTRAVGWRGGPVEPDVLGRLRAATGFDGPPADPADPRDAAQFAVGLVYPQGDEPDWHAGPPTAIPWRQGVVVPQRDTWTPRPEACAVCADIVRAKDLREVSRFREGDYGIVTFQDAAPPVWHASWLALERGGRQAWFSAPSPAGRLGVRGGWTWLDLGRTDSGACVVGLRGDTARVVCRNTDDDPVIPDPVPEGWQPPPIDLDALVRAVS